MKPTYWDYLRHAGFSDRLLERSYHGVDGWNPGGRSGNGDEVTLEESALNELKSALRGQLLLAGNDGYDAARRVLNPSYFV